MRSIRFNKMIHQTWNAKRWWRNMDNRILNYLHMGEDNNMRWIHMNQKCRIDRVGVYPYLGKWW